MDNWSSLSIKDKSDIMRVAIENGITDLGAIKAKYNEFADGGNLSSLPEGGTLVDENNYNKWRNNLPDNLKNTEGNYDMRRAFKAGMQPVLESDGKYHLGSRDPKTGRILKSPYHPTFLMATATDARMGYYPKTNSNGVTFTDTWKGNQFKEGGHVYDELPQLLKDAGLDIRVTSGFRGPRYDGDKSRHMHHRAVDIVPQGKTTFEDIEKAVYGNPAIYNYMLDNDLGLLDETGRTQASRNTMKKTRATGAHFHFGDDEVPAKRFADKMSSLWDNKMESINQGIATPALPMTVTPAFTSTPLPMFNPYSTSYQPPVVQEPEQPLVQAANEYSQEALDRQDRQERLQRFGLLMSILNPQESNPFTSAISMLSGNMFGGGGNKSSFVRSLETQPTILEQVAEYNKEPKVRKAIKETVKQQRIREQKAANQRERNIAKQYLAAGPNITNLAKAVYHWYNSVPILGGQSEDGNDYITGIVDAPGMRNPKSIVKGVSTITKANAAKITPAQWTTAQDAAIARGDMTEAQRLRDLHFKVSAPNTKTDVPLWTSSEEAFNSFDLSHFGETDSGFFGYGHYLTPIEKYAATYHPVNRKFYANIENPYIGSNDQYFNRIQYVKDRLAMRKENVMRNLRDGKLTKFSKKLGINENTSLEDAERLVDKYIADETIKWNDKYVKYADEFKGKDGVLSWRELQGIPNKQEGIYREVVVPRGEQIKSADAVTYDDKGIRIPLGDRDNFNINDIRYAIAPILAGGIGYGVYNDQKALGGNLFDIGGNKGRYWVDDDTMLPELLVTPKGNSIVRDEAGNPALTVGAIRDINPNATIYERINRELKNNQYNTELPQWIVNMNADRYANAVSPGIGDLVTAGLKPLDAMMPSRWVGLLDSDNNKGLVHLFDEDNRGFFIGNDPTKPFSKRYAEEHPLWATAGNLSGDIFSVPLFRATKSAIGMGYNAAKPTISKVTTTLQNNYPALFDPYTSWDATLGYHGDNIFSRAIGTVARRHGLTSKAEIPEFHRRLAITKPEAFRLTNDGKFIMSSGRTGDGHEGIVNFATSEAARSHNKHKYLSGIDDFIVHPKAFEGVDFKSIQPSDTFFEMPLSNTEFAVEPKYITFVSGEPEALDYARSIGMKTLSSPRLRALEADKPTFSNLSDRIYGWKGAHSENTRSIGNEIQRLTSMRGAPTMKDYAYFEDITGLNSGVVPASRWTGTNEIDLFGRKSGVRGVPVFNNVAYDPATNIEALYRKAKTGEGTWQAYYEALGKMPSARQQLGLNSAMDTYFEGYLTLKPQTRTRVGDVEMDDPNLLYHLDRGDGTNTYGGLEDTMNAAEKGRNTLLDWVNGPYYMERLKDEPLYRVAEDVVNDADGLIRNVPLNYSRNTEQLGALGKTSPRPNITKIMPDGTELTISNPNLDVSIASNLGDSADTTALHELLHYMTANSNGEYVPKGLEKVIKNGWFSPNEIHWPSINAITRERASGWQNFIMDQNNALLPKYDRAVSLVMEKPEEAKNLFIKAGKTEKEAEDAVQKLRDHYSYLYDIQEQRAYLQELFLSKIRPNLKNPNDAAEIESYLTAHPEILNNSERFNEINEMRPGSIKDYAKYFSAALGTIPFIKSNKQ